MPPKRSRRTIGGTSSLIQEEDASPPVSPLANAEWRNGQAVVPEQAEPAKVEPAIREVIKEVPVLDVATIAEMLPALHEPRSDTSELVADEVVERAQYEQVLGFADSLYWVRGRVLHGLRTGRHYRSTHTSWDAYCEQVLDLSERRANQLIEVWELGAALHSGPGKIFPGLTINESHAKVLLRFATDHGNTAAAFVVGEIATVDTKLTAATLKGALGVLPADRFDEEEAAQLLKEYLSAEVRVVPPPRNEPEAKDVLANELRRLRSMARTVAKAAPQDPEAARRFADELAGLAEEIRTHIS